MDTIIIYPDVNGGIAIVSPNLDCELSIEDIAKKDVPEGIPFRFIDRSELPSHVDLFEAWEADFSKPDGIGVGHKAWYGARGIKI
jgi:hypothetical protein